LCGRSNDFLHRDIPVSLLSSFLLLDSISTSLLLFHSVHLHIPIVLLRFPSHKRPQSSLPLSVRLELDRLLGQDSKIRPRSKISVRQTSACDLHVVETGREGSRVLEGGWEESPVDEAGFEPVMVHNGLEVLVCSFDLRSRVAAGLGERERERGKL
jgi:hypothetical protein